MTTIRDASNEATETPETYEPFPDTPPLAYIAMQEDEEQAAKERERAAAIAADSRPGHGMPWYAYVALLVTAVAGLGFIIYGAIALARK